MVGSRPTGLYQLGLRSTGALSWRPASFKNSDQFVLILFCQWHLPNLLALLLTGIRIFLERHHAILPKRIASLRTSCLRLSDASRINDCARAHFSTNGV